MKISVKNRQTQQGFTLIESLLTLFILTVGLLGVAGMQMEGLRSGDLAMQRTSVVIKAQEMMERMRAIHPAIFAQYLAVFTTATAKDNGCNISGTVCNPTMVAEHDIFMWQRELETLVPVLTASTAFPSAGNSVTVAINWEDRGVVQTYSITSVLTDNVIYGYR